MWIPWAASVLMALGAGWGSVHGDGPESRLADVHRARVRIVAPAEGAVVWGVFSVGVEVQAGMEDAAGEGVQLLLSDGSLLEPQRPLWSMDPVRRYVFTLDAAQLGAGPLELRARIPGEDALTSSALGLRVVHPDEGDVVRGECEEHISARRPRDFGEETPRLGSRGDASAGVYVVNSSAEPMWVLPFEVPESAVYQMMVVARGDHAGGALPSIGLLVDSRDGYRTSSRLVDRGWHRMPVGFPVELEKGRRHLALRFLNDFFLPNTADRNLYLDRFELLRVEPEGPAAGAYDMGLGMAMAVAMGNMSASGEGGGVRMGLTQAIDGLPVNGRLQIEAVCRWAGMETSPAPWVDLLIENKIVATQQAAKPLFAIDRSALTPGPNRIRMLATLPDGRRGETPEQVVYVSGEPRPTAPPRDAHRFSVVDERWDDVLRASHTELGEEPGHRVANPTQPEVFRLELPEHLVGEFEVLLEARGPRQPAAGILDLTLETEAGAEPVGQARIQNWWNFTPAGEVTLREGPKQLALVLGDGSHESTGNDDRLLLRSLILRSRRADPDRGPPTARVLYPAPDHVAQGVDTVIALAWDDDDRLRSGDLLIDGVPQGTYGHIPGGAGYLVFPMILRGIAPGPHVLSVRVEDAAGNQAESLEVPFVVAGAPPAEPGPYARALRILDRFAHGPEPQQLAALLIQGERPWLEAQLAERGAGDLSAHALALAQMRDLYAYAVTRAAITHAIGTSNPTWSRFTWWLENHFSTWIRKSGPGPEWREHETFLRMGPTSFRELLTASATSPAMLVYLDQRESYAGRLNENYAREIMELHTLGVDGGYTQEDVTELASMLAGLTLAEEALPSGVGGVMQREFRFAPELGDGRERELLGRTFERTSTLELWDRFEELMATLASHPSTSRFVAASLVEHYVATPPPADLVQDLAAVFRETDGDMRAVLLALAAHPTFLDPQLPPRVMTPLDYGFRLARLSGVPNIHWALQGYLERAGMGYFDRSTPDGYPEEDAAWVDTNVTMQRWNLARDVPWAVHRLAPDGLRAGAAGDVEAWRQKVIDVIAVRFTGWTLGEESNRAALDYFDELRPNAWAAVNEIAVLVAQLPEAGLE